MEVVILYLCPLVCGSEPRFCCKKERLLTGGGSSITASGVAKARVERRGLSAVSSVFCFGHCVQSKKLIGQIVGKYPCMVVSCRHWRYHHRRRHRDCHQNQLCGHFVNVKVCRRPCPPPTVVAAVCDRFLSGIISQATTAPVGAAATPAATPAKASTASKATATAKVASAWKPSPFS